MPKLAFVKGQSHECEPAEKRYVRVFNGLRGYVGSTLGEKQ